jgi:hypothetical protein
MEIPNPTWCLFLTKVPNFVKAGCLLRERFYNVFSYVFPLFGYTKLNHGRQSHKTFLSLNPSVLAQVEGKPLPLLASIIS